ncbi:MAG: 3-methyl-2-oxobutanoate hydroxymethyltransferase [Candidatus Omnitrophica bacterium]|nr:3-methyl-2-oxobutanoate hydroxymethyltransferase [Candidatus Omnitrophota bacterium]
MRVTIKDILARKGSREKITALTCYDYLTARILDEAGLDILLVGDSLGMVMLGYESTVPVTMRDMLHHVKAVCRGAKKSLVTADMPLGSYDNPAQAVRNARRFMKEGGADAVKLEGGARIRKQIESLTAAGVPVMGHLGLTPQSASQLGGYRVQGQGRREAEAIVRDAVLLDRLGVFALVLECVPAQLGAKVTRSVRCPTIGIGAGPKTDGQVLVTQDMLGYETKVSPKFVRRYASLGAAVRKAAKRFSEDVRRGAFPAAQESY